MLDPEYSHISGNSHCCSAFSFFFGGGGELQKELLNLICTNFFKKSLYQKGVKIIVVTVVVAFVQFA